MALITSVSMTTALFAAAFTFAAPATADDQLFADALDMIGVSVGDPAAVGRGVCASFDAGQTLPAVVDQLSAAHGISVDDASMVAGFSVAEYCDHHEGALTLG